MWSQYSQLVDENVRDPDAVRGNGQLGDVVKVLGVPLEKFIRPELGEEWEWSQAASHYQAHLQLRLHPPCPGDKWASSAKIWVSIAPK